MTGREYVNQIRVLTARIEQCEAERQPLSGIDYSRPVVQSSPDPDADKIRYVEIGDQIRKYKRQLHKIIDTITSLDNDLYLSLLFRRYVQRQSLIKIAKDFGYSYDWVRHLHSRALSALEKII